MNLPDGKIKRTLWEVLLVPKLAYNLFSVSKATEAGESNRVRKVNMQCKGWKSTDCSGIQGERGHL